MAIKFKLNTMMITLSLLISSTVIYADTTFTPEQQKAIEKITHDYLLSNPKILTEMVGALQKQQQAQWQETAKKVVPQSAKVLFSSHESPAIGNPKGDVTLVEFFDYECPHCKEMAPQIADLIKTDKNLNVIFKSLPIFGNISVYAAKAGLAAAKQGKFDAFHIALMGVQTEPLTQDIILKTAQQVGLDTAKLQSDMKDPAFDQELKQNDQLARDLKLTGTPAFVVAKVQGEKIENPILIPGAVPGGILNNAITEVRSGQTK
jgi:protein-disulfide isomerase